MAAVESAYQSPWDVSFEDQLVRLNELVGMTEAERQSALARVLRTGFSIGQKSSRLDNQISLHHCLADQTEFELSKAWQFGEDELKSLTKVQLLRVLGSMGLDAKSFSKAKKSELATVAARYASSQKWTLNLCISTSLQIPLLRRSVKRRRLRNFGSPKIGDAVSIEFNERYADDLPFLI